MGKKSRKINVLQLVEGFNLGGAEKKLLELVREMDQSRFRIILCSLGLGDEIGQQFLALRELGIDVIKIPRLFRLDLSLIYRLIRLIKKEKIDVIMTTLFYADIIGPIAGRLAGVKMIYSWETISAPEWLIFRRLWPYRLVIRLADSVISVSQATAKWLIEERGVPEKQVRVVPYGVDLKRFTVNKNNKLKKTLGFSDETIIIGMVGRLHPQKGHRYLIRAAEEIVKDNQNICFLLIGDGVLRIQIEQMIKKKGLQQYFKLLGFRDDVQDLLQVIDIFTLPSLYEGLPNVILEAMATAKPIVASNVDGNKELIVDSETGFLIEPKDVKNLVKSLNILLKHLDKAVQMGLNGRKRVEQYFSLEKQIKSFEDLYENCYINR